MKLTEGERGTEYEIYSILLSQSVKSQLNDLGICENARCVLISTGSFNGPIAIKINRTIIALRRAQAMNIYVKKAKNAVKKANK